ncbi:MAG: MoxR family ATPase [Acutalibacteraceae bacterium]|nr:MoxR family ATPase [Acutalibacteraceae bacterium]
METDNNKILLEKIGEVKKEISKAVLGKEEIIDKILTVVVAGGHILLEDIPGVGKTTLALALSKATSLEYKRLQFTPDVLPTDVTGFTVYDKKSDSFIYKPGAALCNLFLADEINRTSSKTQSALLEIMEEGHITVDGVMHKIPKPFTVIATQNPIGYVGTQMLPESQLDRFAVRLSMGYPDEQDEVNILKGKQGRNPLKSVNAVASGEDIIAMRKAVEEVYTDDKIFNYIVALAGATRNNEMLSLGISPRGTVAIAKLARAHAFMQGRDYVVPDDVTNIFLDAAEHRVALSPKAKIGGLNANAVLTSILKQVKCPGIN